MSGSPDSSPKCGRGTGGAVDCNVLSESSGSAWGGDQRKSESAPPAPVNSPRSSSGAPGKAA
eukprot:7415586-Alexandrium_andersonii.AAC.1